LSDEELEVLITNRRVQKLKRELQGEVDTVFARNTTYRNADYEAEIQEDEAKKVPGLGDNGVAVILQGAELKRAESLMKVEAFNILLSDRIPYSRTLPDARNPK
jgi:ribosome maturation protein Sdo1